MIDREVTQRTTILAIECAVGGGSVALLGGPRGIQLRDSGNDCSRAEKIILVIDGILDEAGLRLGDIERVAVSTGPGSYSGIRIGLSTAMGLASALDIPCIGIPVLDAMASASNAPMPLIVAVPVGRNDVAWATYQSATAGSITATDHAELSPLSEFVEKLSRRNGHSVLAHAELVAKLPERQGDASLIDAGIGLAEFIGQKASLVEAKPGGLTPIYLRNTGRNARTNAF